MPRLIKRRRLVLAAVVLGTAFAVGCGDDDAGLLHVCRDGSISSYRIDGGSGGLELTGTQDLAGVEAIAVTPGGLFLVAGAATDGAGNGGGMASYAVDRASGTLSRVADAAGPACEMTWLGSSPQCEWLWLQAGETRVVSMRLNKTYHDFYFDYVGYGFDADGRLGKPVVQDFGEWDPGLAAADASAGIFYKAGEPDTISGPGDPSTLVAYSIQADGTLTRTRSTKSCGTSALSPEGTPPHPVLAAGGFVFTATVVSGQHVLCSHRGSGLTIGDSYPFDTQAAAFLPPVGSRAALLALVAPSDQQSEVRIVAITSDGRFQPHFSLPMPASPVAGETVGELLFHPNGELLFALGTKGSAFVYALEPSGGRLVRTQTAAAGATTSLTGRGRMAVTP